MIEESIVLGQVYIGKQGEHLVRRVRIPEVNIWKCVYGEGVFELWHKRCGDTEPYLIELEIIKDCGYWNITLTDTAHVGEGQCELRYTVNGKVVKSQTAETTVLAFSAVDPEPGTTPGGSADIIGEMLEIKAEVLEAKEDIEELCENLPEKVVVDTALNANSYNPIANSAVTNKFAEIEKNGGGNASVTDENGNFALNDNIVNCKAYYIKSIDLNNKKIYLSKQQYTPVISSTNNTDSSFATPSYNVGKLFCIINGNQYLMRASIASVENNVITYDGDIGFTAINADEGIDAYTFFVPEQPEIGVVNIVVGGFGVGNNGIVAGSFGATLGYGGVALKYAVTGGKECRAAFTATSFGEESNALGQGSSTIGVKCKTTPDAYGADARGIKTIASSHGQSVRGRYNAPIASYDIIDIVGNGTSDEARSNAYILDRFGNARFCGKVFMGSAADDENAKELVTREYAEAIGNKLSIVPYILKSAKNGKLYSSTRASCLITSKKDNDGIVYDHIIPQNSATKMIYDIFDTAIESFLIPLESGKVYLKLLMRTNQKVKPSAELYRFENESGATISATVNVAAKDATSGSGKWEEVLIEISGYKSEIYLSRQIHIRLAGFNTNGSDFYDANGNLIGNPYFDIAGWAIFTDETECGQYEFYNEMIGIGSLSLKDIDRRLKQLEDGGLLGDISSGSFKKIGYTSDCDYIVTSDAVTTFNQAISEASDGDTILVMPGTYGSNQILYIEKNLNFVGVRMPILNFVISIPCTSTFDDSNYEFIYGDSYTVGFQGIRFLKPFIVGIVTGPGECDASDVICDGCHFTVPSMEISGTFYNCYIKSEGSIKTGSYYGETSSFFNCDVSCTCFAEADVYAYGSNIRLKGGNYNIFGGGGSYTNCDIYINTSGLDDSCEHMWIEFYNCRFYGYELGRNTGTYSECYKVSETVM